MFTGIVTATSPILKHQKLTEGLKLTFQTPTGWSDITEGESINTSGVCLTVTTKSTSRFSVFLMPETLDKTTFGGHQLPSEVNLERAMSASDRLGGHFVQGHVDTTGIIKSINSTNGFVMTISYPGKFDRYVIPKGSITVDGVALTIVEHNKAGLLSVAIIPYTLEHTAISVLHEGDLVNLEFDMLGKYVINYMESVNHAKS